MAEWLSRAPHSTGAGGADKAYFIFKGMYDTIRYDTIRYEPDQDIDGQEEMHTYLCT